MLEFFNGLGKTFETITENKIERVYLTEEILLNLLKNKKRSLKGHRGSYKTTAIVVIGSILRLLLEPNIRIAIIRKNFTKSSEILQTISKMMKTKEVKQLFALLHGTEPRAIKDMHNMITYNFKTDITAEGNINAYGIHQDMIGKHFDLIICDDFITIDDKSYKVERESTKLHLNEITNNILDPGKQLMCLGTVWHKDDAWKICPDALIFDWNITGIMTDEDKLEITEGKTRLSRIMLAANYELKHIAGDDQMFTEANFLRWDYHYKTRVYAHLDCKYSGNHTNGFTIMVRKDDGRIQAVGFCFHEHIEDKLDFVYDKWKKYFCGTLYNEENADKGFVAKLLREKGIPVETYHEATNKHVKIENFLYKYWNYIDWDIDTDPEYISQILDYTEGEEPDDCPDSGACLIRAKFDKDFVDMNRWKW